MASALLNMMVDEENKSSAPKQPARPVRPVKRPARAQQAIDDAEAKANPPQFGPEALKAYQGRVAAAATPERKPIIDLNETIDPNAPFRTLGSAPPPETPAPKSTAAGDIMQAFGRRYGQGQEMNVPATRTPEEEEQYRAAQARIGAGQQQGFEEGRNAAIAGRNQPAPSNAPVSLGQWVGKGARPATSAPAETSPQSANLIDDQGNLQSAVDFFGRPFTETEKKTAQYPSPSMNVGSQTFPTEVRKAAVPQQGQSTFESNLDGDVLLADFQGKEMPTMTMVSKFKSAIQSGVSFKEAARRVYNSATDADKDNPFYKVLETYNGFKGRPNQTNAQSRLLDDGLAAVSDYFDRGARGVGGHTKETFRDALDLINFAGDPEMTAGEAYKVSPDLMDVMSDSDSVFATKFGSSAARSERTQIRRFDEVYTGVNNVLTRVAKKSLESMSRGDAPAFRAARDIASTVLGPLAMDKPEGMSSLDWAESSPLRNKLADALYSDASLQFERKGLGTAYSFNQQMANDVVARRFGGQFDVAATLKQITEPNFKGREREFVMATEEAKTFKAQNNDKKAAQALSPFYTTEALNLMFGETGVEGYESGRRIGVSTGAGSDLTVAMRRSEQEQILANIKRSEAPLRTGLNPYGLLGALLGEQGLEPSLFSLAAPRTAYTERINTGQAPQGKTTVFRLTNHPDAQLQVTSKTGDAISFDDRKYITKMQALLDKSDDPRAFMKQLEKDPRYKELSKRNTFTLGQSRDMTVVQNDFSDMTKGARLATGAKALETMADVTTDVKQLLRIPTDENGQPYFDKDSVEMYDAAKSIQTKLKESLAMYNKQGDEYVLTGAKPSADMPAVLSPAQYDSVRNSLSTINSLIDSADDIRAQVGGTGVSTGFALKADGTPDFMRPRQVSGEARLDQTLDMLNHWSSGRGSDINFNKFFSGMNLVEGTLRGGAKSTVTLAPVDINGRPIMDASAKSLIRQYDVDPKDGTANVIQYQKVGDKWVPIIGENGQPKTTKVRTNQQTERFGISTASTASASSSRFGLPASYIVSSFNQLHRELNKAFETFPDTAETFARYVMRNNDPEVIKQIGATGVTQEELQKVLTTMSRTQGSALHSIIEIARGREFKPEARAAGTMNATSGARQTGSQLEQNVINRVNAGDKRAAQDIVVENNKTVLQSAFATARNIYEQEGAGTDKESQIERITKMVLQDRTGDADVTPELRTAFEQAVKRQVTSLVYEDRNDNSARLDFMKSVYGYAQDVVEAQNKAGTLTAGPSVSGAGVSIADGQGKAADRAQSKKNLATNAITDAIKLLTFDMNSNAMKSFKVARSTFTDGIYAAIEDYNNATSREAKSNALNDLVKRIATARNAGFKIPNAPNELIEAPTNMNQVNVNVSLLTMDAKTRKKVEMARRKALVRARKYGPTTPAVEDVNINTDTNRPTRGGEKPVFAKPKELIDPTMSSTDLSAEAKKILVDIRKNKASLSSAEAELVELNRKIAAKSTPKSQMESLLFRRDALDASIKRQRLEIGGQEDLSKDFVKAISDAKVREEREAIAQASKQPNRRLIKVSNTLGFRFGVGKTNTNWVDALQGANAEFERQNIPFTKERAVQALVKMGLAENVANELIVERPGAGFGRESAGITRPNSEMRQLGARVARRVIGEGGDKKNISAPKVASRTTPVKVTIKGREAAPAPAPTPAPVASRPASAPRQVNRPAPRKGSRAGGALGWMSLLGIGTEMARQTEKDVNAKK